MKKGEIYEGRIEKVLFPNRGFVTADHRCEAEDFLLHTEGKSAFHQDSAVKGEENVSDSAKENQVRVVVKNGIPGQYVRYRICKKKHGTYEGQLLQVLEKSSLETESAGCREFPSCGGCMYRTMSYQSQLDMKEAQIRAMFEPLIRADAAAGQKDFSDIFEGVYASPLQNGYRNKMEFAFGDAEPNGPLTLGLHKKGSTYDILTTDDCQIVNEDFNCILHEVLEFCREKGWTYYHKKTHHGYLRHLLVRRAVMTGEILVDLVTSSQYGETVLFQKVPPVVQERDPETGNLRKKVIPNPYIAERSEDSHRQEHKELMELNEKLHRLPLEGKLAGVLHTVNDSVADIIRNDGTEILSGNDYFYEELLGLSFKITPFSFFQTNSKGAEVLYGKVREYAGNIHGQTVFDLYSGTGTIAQVLAPVCDHVVGVEIVKEAVEAARENAALNQLDNCEFLAGDVLKVLDTIPEKPDTIILDPPRDGVHPKALPKILSYGVDKIVYVSCKATSLARDLPIMMAHGYRVEKMSCTDMFPGTVQIETVCLLEQPKIQV